MLDDAVYDEIIGELGHKRALAKALDEKLKRVQRASFKGPGGLLRFIEHFWHILEPNREFVKGWALEAMCAHLEAVSRGDITRLLINVPPGSMKSLLVNVWWPAWEWAACERPDLRYVSFSYASHLTERDNQKFLDLIQCFEFQRLYGHQFTLRDRGKVKVSNSKTGWKFASSVEGVGTGERGDRVVLDDPHNIKDGESDPIRERAVRFFREAMSNRLNDLSRSVIIVIMQRVNEADVSGDILASELGYTHLCIPLEYEPDRHCRTFVKGKLFWSDPRTEAGESFWRERFGPAEVAECLLMGEFVYAGQYQQRPEPRGGGLFKRGYWESFDKNDTPRDFKFDFILGSLDSAFTDKTRNDPSAFSVWGCFRDSHGNRSVLLMHAWRKHLQLNGKCRKRRKGEALGDYKDGTWENWGLVQWVAYELERLKATRLLIENKASGIDVSNEMDRLFGRKKWITELVDPAGLDKWARAQRTQPMFSEGLIYAPGFVKDEQFTLMKHAKLVIDEMALFDKGKYDDLTDTATQAIWWLRQNRYLVLNEEYRAEAAAKARKYKQIAALYPC